VELWGAQGYDRHLGGRGAYTKGRIYLNSGEVLFVYVGNSSSDGPSFNGGGNDSTIGSGYAGPGGGASDVRLVNGSRDNSISLCSRIMVAAGGGGAEFMDKVSPGGVGGGLTGAAGVNNGNGSITRNA
jgi:hypothetical protein